MNKDEANQISLALDGISANIETLRLLINNSVETAIPALADGSCGHTQIREIQTHGGNTMFCDDCGYQL